MLYSPRRASRALNETIITKIRKRIRLLHRQHRYLLPLAGVGGCLLLTSGRIQYGDSMLRRRLPVEISDSKYEKYTPTGHEYSKEMPCREATYCLENDGLDSQVTYMMDGKGVKGHRIQRAAFDEEINEWAQKRFREMPGGAGPQNEDKPKFFYNGSIHNPFDFKSAPEFLWAECDIVKTMVFNGETHRKPRELFWPAPMIRQGHHFDMKATGSIKGLDDGFDVLENYPQEFGYITVFKLADSFYDDGGTVIAEAADHPDPARIHEMKDDQIFARKGYKKLNFGDEERDAFVLNQECFLKAKMHPVLVIKIYNPWGESKLESAEAESEEHKSAEPALSYTSFGSLSQCDLFQAEKKKRDDELEQRRQRMTDLLQPGQKVVVMKGQNKGRKGVITGFLKTRKRWGISLDADESKGLESKKIALMEKDILINGWLDIPEEQRHGLKIPPIRPALVNDDSTRTVVVPDKDVGPHGTSTPGGAPSASNDKRRRLPIHASTSSPFPVWLLVLFILCSVYLAMALFPSHGKQRRETVMIDLELGLHHYD